MEKSEKMQIYVFARIAAALERSDVNDVLADAEAYATRKSAPKTDDNGRDGVDDKEEKKKAAEAELDAIVDRLYKLYPTTTWRDGGMVSTCKGEKDRRKLRKLLKNKPAEEIEVGIKKYVAECNGRYLKNFSTFLNNFPDPDSNVVAEIRDLESSIFGESVRKYQTADYIPRD